MFELSFLNAGLLFFAAATVLPLLIWLLAKKKPRRIVFSSLRFIKLSQQQEKSRTKITNIILLLIRMLIILLVALAIARPMLASSRLKKSGKQFEYPVDYGQNLQSEHERYLTEQHFKSPVTVYNYPKEIKPFYMRLNDDGKTVTAMDVLVPGIGEVIGGAQREERLDHLCQKGFSRPTSQVLMECQNAVW